LIKWWIGKYLCIWVICLLPFEGNENAYNLRNQTDYSNPFTRLQLYRNSFFPSSIKLWNNLTPEIRSAPTTDYSDTQVLPYSPFYEIRLIYDLFFDQPASPSVVRLVDNWFTNDIKLSYVTWISQLFVVLFLIFVIVVVILRLLLLVIIIIRPCPSNTERKCRGVLDITVCDKVTCDRSVVFSRYSGFLHQ
jgi:hypothetical protein